MARSTVIQVRRWTAVALAVSIMASVAICAQSPPATEPILHDLNGIDDLRAQFDSAHDTIRVVMLLSPT